MASDISIYLLRLSVEIGPHIILIWKESYLDDIFVICRYDMNAFPEFLDILNTHDKPIKFNSFVRISSIDYLDTIVFKEHDNSKTVLNNVFLNQRTHISCYPNIL